MNLRISILAKPDESVGHYELAVWVLGAIVVLSVVIGAVVR